MHLPHPIRTYEDLKKAKSHIAGERQALGSHLQQERRQITHYLARNWFLTETGMVLFTRLTQWAIRLTRKPTTASDEQHATDNKQTWALFFLELAQELGPIIMRRWAAAREGSYAENK